MKKLRGMHRQARQIGQWQRTVPEPSPLETLAHWQYAVANLAPTGWRSYLSATDYRHPAPPPGIRRTMLAGLLTTYHHWQQALQQLPEPYYLRLWIDEREFVRSEVVAAVGARLVWYDGLFETPVPSNPPLPVELRQVPGAQELHWQAYYNETVFAAEELTADPFLAKWVLRHPHRITEQAGERISVVTTGRCWVGGQRTGRT